MAKFVAILTLYSVTDLIRVSFAVTALTEDFGTVVKLVAVKMTKATRHTPGNPWPAPGIPTTNVHGLRKITDSLHVSGLSATGTPHLRAVFDSVISTLIVA